MESLPNEILIYIFSFLVSEDFFHIPLINKRMSDLSGSDYVWEMNFHRNFPNYPTKAIDREFYMTFYQSYQKFLQTHFTKHIFRLHHPTTNNEIYYIYNHVLPPFDITSLGTLQPDITFLKPSIFYYTLYRDYLPLHSNDWIMIKRERGDKSYNRKILEGECQIIKDEEITRFLPKCSYFVRGYENIPIRKLLNLGILQIV